MLRKASIGRSTLGRASILVKKKQCNFFPERGPFFYSKWIPLFPCCILSFHVSITRNSQDLNCTRKLIKDPS